jgi:hypothetical protein
VRPADLPPPDRFAHGTRPRYVSGCRCDACRVANTAYARTRALAKVRGEWNGLVDAAPARQHLVALSRAGVGYRSVAAASDVAITVLVEVLSGAKQRIRARTAKRILAVDEGAMADGALVDARPSWRLIREMLRDAGLTKGEIAQRLGHETPALQLGKARVFASTALQVRRLHAEVMRELEAERALPRLCRECGFTHAPEDRRAVVLRMLPCTTEELREAHPCWWAGAPGSAKEALLYRDLRAAGAEKVDGVWTQRDAPRRAA